MRLKFSEPLLMEQPAVVFFPSCKHIHIDNKEAQVTLDDGRTFCVATVEANKHMLQFRIHPQAYAAIYKCPPLERPWCYWAVGVDD